MPTIKAICEAAKLKRADFNTIKLAGRTADWGEEGSEGFAIRVGLYAALRASGFLSPDAAAMAHSMAGQELPQLLIRGPLEGTEGTEVRVYSPALNDASLSKLFALVASAPGRQVIGDGPPDPDLDTPPEADVVTVINVPAVADRMKRLFK